MPSFFPTNVGYLPTGVNSTAQVSSIFLGRSQSGTYEGIGPGLGGRPDYAQVVQINLTSRAGDGTLTQKAAITMNVSDLAAIAGLPSTINMTLKEITICDNGTSKKAIVLMSQLYT